MWKNIVERGRPQMTIWRIHIACWIPKATNTHSQYVILIAFPPQQWLHERAGIYVICTVPFFWEGVGGCRFQSKLQIFPYTVLTDWIFAFKDKTLWQYLRLQNNLFCNCHLFPKLQFWCHDTDCNIRTIYTLLLATWTTFYGTWLDIP
jgi:hypothetical protein